MGIIINKISFFYGKMNDCGVDRGRNLSNELSINVIEKDISNSCVERRWFCVLLLNEWRTNN